MITGGSTTFDNLDYVYLQEEQRATECRNSSAALINTLVCHRSKYLADKFIALVAQMDDFLEHQGRVLSTDCTIVIFLFPGSFKGHERLCNILIHGRFVDSGAAEEINASIYHVGRYHFGACHQQKSP